MTARLRPELAELPAYVPGKTVPGAIKLASNETVQGPLPSVRAAIERATDVVNRYPDNGCAELKSALAKHLNSGRVGSPGGWAAEHIAVGCGSVSLCQQLIQISATAGDEVLFGWRSFEIYPLQVRLAGATAVVPTLGRQWAKFLMITGELLNANLARWLGLVLSVERDEELTARAQRRDVSALGLLIARHRQRCRR